MCQATFNTHRPTYDCIVSDIALFLSETFQRSARLSGDAPADTQWLSAFGPVTVSAHH